VRYFASNHGGHVQQMHSYFAADCNQLVDVIKHLEKSNKVVTTGSGTQRRSHTLVNSVIKLLMSLFLSCCCPSFFNLCT
jgi:hypothetical protein